MIEDLIIGDRAMQEHIALIRERCKEMLAALGEQSATVRIHVEIGVDLYPQDSHGWCFGDSDVWEGRLTP